MSTRPPLIGKLFLLAIIWVFLAGIGAVLYRFIIAPAREDRLISQTSAEERFDRTIRLGIDSFTGYAVLRSEAMRTHIEANKIGLELIDDAADYSQRLKHLDKGKLDAAVFPIDALITASAKSGDLPATVVLLLDETVGADALVAYKAAVPDLDALNYADANFVVTPSSPSETLARIARQQFALSRQAHDFEAADGAQAVYNQLRQADPSLKRAYALWEPYVSKALQDDNVHVLLDSGRFRGYIVDALVVSRKYLQKHRAEVKALVSSYLQALHHHRASKSGLTDLVREDTNLDDAAVENLVAGIWWKHTEDNFAHFGLTQADKREHIDRVLKKITDLLLQTGAIDKDPAEGKVNRWYYPSILADLQSAHFHPGAINDGRQVQVAVPSFVDWSQLRSIGTVDMPTLVFGRGNAVLTQRSVGHLDKVVAMLADWPGALLLIKGQARSEGDLDANKALASKRAESVRNYLIEKGVDPKRLGIRTDIAAGSQTVAFVLGRTAY